jgi:hypothetical protein
MRIAGTIVGALLFTALMITLYHLTWLVEITTKKHRGNISVTRRFPGSIASLASPRNRPGTVSPTVRKLPRLEDNTSLLNTIILANAASRPHATPHMDTLRYYGPGTAQNRDGSSLPFIGHEKAGMLRKDLNLGSARGVAVEDTSDKEHTLSSRTDPSSRSSSHGKCTRPAAFGTGDERACFGDALVKSVTVHAPNCNETCGGVRYYSKHPEATYTVEVFTDRSFERVHNSTASCKIAILWEPPADSVGMYFLYYFSTDKNLSRPFHKVLTTSDSLIQSDQSKFMRYLSSDVWVRKDPRLVEDSDHGREVAERYLDAAISGKSKGISMIFSYKQYAPGHKMRHVAWKELKRRGLTGMCACMF